MRGTGRNPKAIAMMAVPHQIERGRRLARDAKPSHRFKNRRLAKVASNKSKSTIINKVKTSKTRNKPPKHRSSWNGYVHVPVVGFSKKLVKATFKCPIESDARMNKTPKTRRDPNYRHDRRLKNMSSKDEAARGRRIALQLGKEVGTIVRYPCLSGVGPVVWLMDTGTPFDIVSKYDVTAESRSKRKKDQAPN